MCMMNDSPPTSELPFLVYVFFARSRRVNCWRKPSASVASKKPKQRPVPWNPFMSPVRSGYISLRKLEVCW